MCADHLENGIEAGNSIYEGAPDSNYLDKLKSDHKSNSNKGLHETWLNYHNCPSSQSPAEKHGFECPTERNLYPYPQSPFFDIAHLSSNCTHEKVKQMLCMKKVGGKYLYQTMGDGCKSADETPIELQD